MKSKLLLLTIVSALFVEAFAIDIVEPVTGYYGRGSNSSFTFSVQINDIDDADDPITQDESVSEDEAKIFIKRRLKLEVANDPVPFDEFGVDNMYVKIISASADVVSKRSNEEVEISAEFEVVFKTVEDFADYQDNGEVDFNVCILGWDGSKATTSCDDDVDGTAEQSFEVVNDKPTQVKLTPTFRSLKASWVVESKPTFTGATPEGKYSATGVNLILIKADGSVSGLPAKNFTGNDPEDDTDASDCSISYTSQTQYSCISCPANTYLDIKAIKQLDAYKDNIIQIREATISESSTTFNKNIDVDSQYLFFASYEPDAVQNSSCYQAQAINNPSMMQLYNPDKNIKLDRECFVATAAYGTDMAQEIEHLRWFRDHVLVNYAVGRHFIVWYYQYGPHMARFIQDKPLLRFGVRLTLKPIVLGAEVLRAWLNSN